MQKVTLFLGEPISEALKENVWKVPVAAFDNSPLIWPDNDLSGDVFRFSYSDKQTSIDMDHVRMIWATQYAGIITSIDVSGSKQKETVNDAYNSAQVLSKQLEQNGWQPQYPFPSLESVAASISRSGRTDSSCTLTTYIKGPNSARIELATPGKALTPQSSSKADFIFNVSFADNELEDRQSKKAYAERRKVQGGRKDSLPFAYWLDLQRQGRF